MGFNIRIGNGISGSGSREESSFGKETVSEIDCSGSVRLNGTTVTGKVDAGGSITATNAHVGKIDAGGSLVANSTLCERGVVVGGSITANKILSEYLEAGGSITVVDSKIFIKVESEGGITANRCDLLGFIKAGGFVSLDECPYVDSVSSNSDITIRQTSVRGNVFAGGDATIENARIAGTLTCSSNHLIIEGCEIDMIDLRCPCGVYIQGGGVFASRNIVVSNGSSISIRGIFTGSNAGGANSSVSIENGNIVIGSDDLDNTFVNGIPLKQLNSKQGFLEKETRQSQIIELRNSTVKNVMFAGGNGDVVLSGTSKVTGRITGGKIRS